MKEMVELLKICKTYGCEVILYPQLVLGESLSYNLVVEEKAEHHHLTNLVATDLKTLAKEALEDVKDTLIEWEVGPRGIIDPKHIHPWRAEKGKT